MHLKKKVSWTLIGKSHKALQKRKDLTIVLTIVLWLFRTWHLLQFLNFYQYAEYSF